MIWSSVETPKPISRDADGLLSLDVWNRSLDRLYRKSDQLYHDIALDCGISETGYWLMYAIYVHDGAVSVRDVAEECCYPKQTISSALRTLESRGLVETSFLEGSRKAKRVSFTQAGRAFVAEKIVPASRAERRAFNVLTQGEQTEMLRLVDKYVAAIQEQIDAMRGVAK